jgi:SAM-dependent methyltransferase
MEGRNGEWDRHYKRDRSLLEYPDENLVRMLKGFLPSVGDCGSALAVDLGCGSGRHIKVLGGMGIGKIIGLDLSYEALRLCGRPGGIMLVQSTNERLPFRDDSADIAVSWGSLHYSRKENLKPMLSEILRILKKGGRLFGTLRSHRDTYLKKGKNIGNDTWITDLKDLSNSIVSFYSEDELRDALGIFRNYSYGIMERSLLGDIKQIISHWFFWAEK